MKAVKYNEWDKITTNNSSKEKEVCVRKNQISIEYEMSCPTTRKC